MNDVIQYQRLASGYVPGLSEAGTPAAVVPPSTIPNFGRPAPTTAELQNCIVLRPVAIGIFDILVGGNNPAPVGIGAVLQVSPPLVAGVAPAFICGQARVSIGVRTILPTPPGGSPTTAAANPRVTWAVFNGSTIGPVPLYTGFSNDQVFRVIFSEDAFLAGPPASLTPTLANVDFDFAIERVIDPGIEP
jgi:hypothetical protein